MSTTNPTTVNGTSTGLRATLERAMEEEGLKMKDLTVLSAQNDPFRVDTPAGHRDGEWLAMHVNAKLEGRRKHLRGLHYMLLGETKPNGETYTSTDEDWLWLQGKAGKAARWLGYIPFDQVTDERNSPPVVREFEPPAPESRLSVGLEVDVPAAEEIEPRPMLHDFRPVQPYKLVFVGEKTSLEDVLAPIAKSRAADLYLPTGEASDTMIYNLARRGAKDGRRMIVFYLSDCDPAGWQMPASLSRKLQAFKALEFPKLDYEVRPIALTPEQVREYGLPSTPLKETEKRADAWQQKMGVQQTEIDSLATLNPELLKTIVYKATKPFFDAGLAERVREANLEWQVLAEQALEAQLGQDQLERLRAKAVEKVAEVRDEIDALNESIQVTAEGIELPPPPPIPTAEIKAEPDGKPLIDSTEPYGLQSRRLKAHRSYESNGA